MFSAKTGRLHKGFIKIFRYNFTLQLRGQLGEWFNPVAWNAAVGQPTVSSNLTLSTTNTDIIKLLTTPYKIDF